MDSEQERMLYKVPIGFYLMVYAESEESAIGIARDESELIGRKIQMRTVVGTPTKLLSSSQIPYSWKDRIPLTDAIDFLEQTSEELLANKG